MEKQIFKKGDRVFYYTKGWGTVDIIYDKESSPDKLCVSVKFDNKLIGTVYFTYRQSALLSFTEYTLQGNSQERPIDYNDYIDKWGKFWNQEEEGFSIGKLKRYHFLNKNHFFFSGRFYYDFFEPFTEEQIKFLKLE